MANVSITSKGAFGSVVVDGQDLSSSVRGYSIHARAGHLPELVLDLVAHEQASIEGEFDVNIPNATGDALIHLGWTPPAA